MGDDDDPLATPGDEAGEDGPEQGIIARHPTAAKWLSIVILVLVAIGAFIGLINTFGVVSGLLYAILFVLGATLMPVTTLLLFDMTPTVVAKLNFMLGQLAYGRPWLVQHEHGWEMHPGRLHDGTEQVHIDGEWHDVPDTEHQTILGWQRFGILLDKTGADPFSEYRVGKELREGDADGPPTDDAVRERLAALEPDDLEVMDEADLEKLLNGGNDAVADGGQSTVTRGGVREVTPDVDEDDDRWWIDLKRVWSAGLEQMGDIELIERVEEVTMREEAASDSADRKRMYVLTGFGLVLGVATGFVAMIGF